MKVETDSGNFGDKGNHVENVRMMEERMGLGTNYAKELDDYIKRCFESEEKTKKAEERCLVLEVEIKVLKKKNEELEEQITKIREVASVGEKGKGRTVDLREKENDVDKFVPLLIENKVLECEKKKVESELEVWKGKVKGLESRVFELESNAKRKAMNESSRGVKGGLDPVSRKIHLDRGKIVIDEVKIEEANDMVKSPKLTVAGDVNWQPSATPYLPDEREARGAKREYHSQARKQLQFEEDGFTNKMAPYTPAGFQPPPPGIIDISDEDADPNEFCKPSCMTPKINKLSDDGDHGDFAKSKCSSKNDLKRTNLEHSGDEEDMNDFKEHSPTVSGKRKRASNTATSLNETGDGEGDPIITCAKSKRGSHIVTSDNEEEDMGRFEGNPPITTGAKRKQASDTVSNDNETSDDEDAPITYRRQHSPTLETDSENEVKYVYRRCPMRQHGPRLQTDSGNEVKEDASRRRSMRLRKSENKDKRNTSTFDPNTTVCIDGVKEGVSRRRSMRLRKSENKDKRDTSSFDPNKTVCFDGVEGVSRRRSMRLRKSDSKDKRNRSNFDPNKTICLDESDSRDEEDSDEGLKTDSEDEGNEDVSKRCSMRLRKPEAKGTRDRITFDPKKTVSLYGNASSEDEEDENEVEDGSESEGESLGGFIIDSSESAYGSDVSCDESDEASDDFEVTMDKIRRKRGPTLKWDLEGDMLADFGKDPELCMRAVCALYRQQTADEKLSKGTIHVNERGFSQCDASRGSKVAEFLTDGDPNGDLNKTLEELIEYDPKGIKLCMALATKYSKQLFEVYRNKEDPYFLPS